VTDASSSSLVVHLDADPQLRSQLQEMAGEVSDEAVVGLVTRAERGGADILTVTGPVTAVTPDPVCTGDWVVLDRDHPEGEERPSVVAVLPRRTAFIRQNANATEGQVLAANIDEVWIVVPLDRPVSIERVERTLVLAWESGATPVVVMTKSDAAEPDDVADVVVSMEAVAPGSPVVVVSVVEGKGLPELAARLPAGRTAALLGASGAGKSSLVNALAGEEVAEVGAVRSADGKGRHTTSWRHLVLLPTGGALIDTPGLRAVGMWVDEGGIDAAFADVSELAATCRFSDCQHRSEPGCAVNAAIAAGTLEQRRLDSYRKLLAEAEWAARRNDARAEAAQRRIWAARSREGKSRARPR
jgi:ribosome biogenesis GTPase